MIKRRKTMTKKEIKEIKTFLADSANVDNCTACPFNDGFGDFQRRKPCGQYNCWVEVHCSQEEDDE